MSQRPYTQNTPPVSKPPTAGGSHPPSFRKPNIRKPSLVPGDTTPVLDLEKSRVSDNSYHPLPSGAARSISRSLFSQQSQRILKDSQASSTRGHSVSEDTTVKSDAMRSRYQSRENLSSVTKKIARSQENVMSWKISEVMEDIGVTREMIRARQKLWLQREKIRCIFSKLDGQFIKTFIAGSHIEGTTTQEMEASIDIVLYDESIHIISDVINAVMGREEYLIHYLHTTPQGYCVLRPMREDAGIPVKDISPKKVNEYNLYGGVVCLTHDRLFPKENGNMGKRQGLVIQSYDESENFVENITNALCLPKMPKDLLKGWIERVQNKMWPREDQMEAILQSELLLVPVGHKKSKSPYIEFRFSFIQAERILMFDLNITQVRCLTLMKILMKTYIDQSFEDGVNKIIPSYFCKTALLYTIEETGNKGWGQYNLLMHTETCLKWILRHIAGNKVPHYFLPDIDLLEGDFDEEIRLETAHKLSAIIASPQSAISQLTIDDIGLRYLQKNAQMIRKILKPPGQIKYEILNYHVNHHMFRFLTEFNRLVYAGLSQHDLNYNVKMVNNALVECKKISKTGDDEVLQTILLIRPMLCTVLGCLLGSQNTSRQLVKTLRALDWLLIGKESDLMSGRLKLASAYYCYGEYGRAEELLDEIEDDFDKDYVLKVCGCRYHTRYEITRGFNDGCFYYINENILHKQSAYCVVFTRCEKPWVPIQFQNEMYRSSPKELKRRKAEDHWMDWACIDSYPFLYFLQYLNYESLRDRKASVKAFRALVEATESEQWYHTETIFNLLGQCYEKENMKEKAHEYYKKSSEIMPNNNAAIKLKRKLRSNLK